MPNTLSSKQETTNFMLTSENVIYAHDDKITSNASFIFDILIMQVLKYHN